MGAQVKTGAIRCILILPNSAGYFSWMAANLFAIAGKVMALPFSFSFSFFREFETLLVILSPSTNVYENSP